MTPLMSRGELYEFYVSAPSIPMMTHYPGCCTEIIPAMSAFSGLLQRLNSFLVEQPDVGSGAGAAQAEVHVERSLGSKRSLWHRCQMVTHTASYTFSPQGGIPPRGRIPPRGSTVAQTHPRNTIESERYLLRGFVAVSREQSLV